MLLRAEGMGWGRRDIYCPKLWCKTYDLVLFLQFCAVISQQETPMKTLCILGSRCSEFTTHVDSPFTTQRAKLQSMPLMFAFMDTRRIINYRSWWNVPHWPNCWLTSAITCRCSTHCYDVVIMLASLPISVLGIWMDISLIMLMLLENSVQTWD